MISLLYFDTEKYDRDSCQQLFNYIKNKMPEDMTIIALPKDCKFYEDVDIEEIKRIRDMFNDIIKREENKENDL